MSLLACGAASSTASGHVVTEAPWHPIAKAYLFGIFVSGHKPVDWPGISQRYVSVDYSDQGGRSVFDMLSAIEGASSIDHAAGIKSAIRERDRKALRVASTRALAQAVRLRMAEARRAFADEPASARRHVAAAQHFFRPFEMFIRQADPEGYRRLGLAWLNLATMAGRASARDSHRTPEDRAAFAESAETIERYTAENFHDASDADVARRGPVPNRGKGRDADWRPDPWLPPDASIADQDPLPRLVLNFEERGVDERDFFLAAYGDMLFDSPEILGEPARSLGIACSTCHNRGDVNRDLFVPGLSRHAGGIDVDSSFFNHRANDMRFDPLDIPSLRGIRYTGPYGRDGRVASLREFTRNVIVTEFAGPEPTPLMLDALTVYMNEFDFLPAPYLGRDGRLNERATAAAKRGEEIFHRPFPQMSGRSCASCHIPDANFVDGRRHDIGSAARSSEYARDVAFDTPTLLGAAYTAPYFHDGSLGTLDGVVEWFNRRFGLNLDAMEQSDLTAFLEAVGTGEQPYESFDDSWTRFRLAFEELSTFLSTLNELIPARDAIHARLLIRTVSRDLRADAGGLADLGNAPIVYGMSDQLEKIDNAIAAGDWALAADLWSQYKDMEERHATSLY